MEEDPSLEDPRDRLPLLVEASLVEASLVDLARDHMSLVLPKEAVRVAARDRLFLDLLKEAVRAAAREVREAMYLAEPACVQ